jgi:Leucine-rich repeat (LRR) protein
MKKLLISEQAFRFLFESDDFSDQLTNLKGLIESGQEENIKLAFEIGEGMESYAQNFKFEKYLFDIYNSLITLLRLDNPQLNEGSMLEKINYLSNLEVVDISNQQLSQLPRGFSILQNLQDLNCQNSQLDSLDVSKNRNLSVLHCDSNNFKVLNINKNEKLSKLFCTDSNLALLDVSRCLKLYRLDCFNSPNLTKVKVPSNGMLSEQKILKDSHTQIEWV